MYDSVIIWWLFLFEETYIVLFIVNQEYLDSLTVEIEGF